MLCLLQRVQQGLQSALLEPTGAQLPLPLLPSDAAALLQHLLDSHLGVFEDSSQIDQGSDTFATVLASLLVELAAKDGALPLLLAQQLKNAAVK